jgi:hypothetical protein
MRRFAVVIGGAALLVASACAAIVGLDDPAELTGADASAADSSPTSDATSANDAPSKDGGPSSDADAGRSCTGTVLKTDPFDDRADPSAGWERDYRGDGGIIETKNGRLHVYVDPALPGVNLRRQLAVTKTTPKRMCATFTVEIVKPQNTMAFADAGNTVHGFISVRGKVGDASPTYYEGVGVELEGPFAYVLRDDGPRSEQVLLVPILTKWNVYLNADFVANTVTLAVNDREATFDMVRPVDPPDEASFSIGIRNLGPVPESEAFFDDVVVTAD